jgi:hypothetical protein
MKRTAFPWLYLGLGLAQTAHSFEEVLTRLWKWSPATSGGLLSQLADLTLFNTSAEHFAAANIVIVVLLIGLNLLIFLKLPWAWKVGSMVAVVETINGIGHSTAAIISGKYFPGCISAIALLAFSIPLWAVPSIRRIPSGAD